MLEEFMRDKNPQTSKQNTDHDLDVNALNHRFADIFVTSLD